MVNRTLFVALALLVAACGKRGDPRPPVPVIPQATSDVVVTQRADKVILSWSYPALTIAGRSLTDFRRISVYRYVEDLPVQPLDRDPETVVTDELDPAVPSAVAAFSRVPTIAGAQFARLATRIDSIEKANIAAATAGARLVFEDTPPFRSADGRPVRLTYAVVTEGPAERSDFSNLAIIVPLPVALPPAPVEANATPEGVTLSWQRPKGSIRAETEPVITGYNIYRTPPGEPVTELSGPINNAPVRSTTYTDTPPYGEHAYHVTAVAAGGPPLIQSAPSEPARVTFRDLVPPPPPSNVEVLIETKAVRLLWTPVEAADLAGYRVYRTEGMGHVDIVDIGTIPMVGQPITENRFVDPGVNLGIAYKYAVTSVDTSGNESARVWTNWVVAPKTP